MISLKSISILSRKGQELTSICSGYVNQEPTELTYNVLRVRVPDILQDGQRPLMAIGHGHFRPLVTGAIEMGPDNSVQVTPIFPSNPVTLTALLTLSGSSTLTVFSQYCEQCPPKILRLASPLFAGDAVNNPGLDGGHAVDSRINNGHGRR